MERTTDSSLTHDLPTHLGVSQPLLRLGPIRLDVTRLAKFGVGCVAAAWVWQLHGPPPGLRLAVVALVVLITLACGAIQPAGQPLEAWLLPLAVYVVRPRLFVWRSRALAHPWAVTGPTAADAGTQYRLTAIQIRWGTR
jgi:hypothetical protein